MAKKKDKGFKGETVKAGKGAGGVGFTDTRRVKELVELMTEAGLSEIELVEDKSRILLRRGGVGGVAVAGPEHVPVMHAAPVAHAAVAAPAAPAAAGGKGEEEGLVAIKSPMVGTYYSSPNPESDAYVSVGTEVEKDKSVVCIIEAMKVFNEIHADVTGKVVKILASNGQAVEYGQPLFLVRPA